MTSQHPGRPCDQSLPLPGLGRWEHHCGGWCAPDSRRGTATLAGASVAGVAATGTIVAGDPNEPVGQDAAPEERLYLVDHEAW